MFFLEEIKQVKYLTYCHRLILQKSKNLPHILDWHDLPLALPDACNETLIQPQRRAQSPHPLWPPLCGTTRGFYQRQEDLMNIHVANTAGDATEFAEISAEKSPSCENTQVHSCCTVCMRGAGGAALSLFSFSLTSRSPTHIQMSKHTNGLESTYMLSCLRGLAGEYLHFSFMRSTNQDNLCNNSAAVRHTSCSISELFVMNPYTAASLSHYWPIKRAPTVMRLTSAQP